MSRRFSQVATIALAILIPASGLFRIDPEAGAFVIIGRQIWFSDFFMMFGFWVMVAAGAIMLYSTAGTVFCGWACPQNTISEWANQMTFRFLGKRANVDISTDDMKIAKGKNKALNWVALTFLLLVASLFYGIIPLFYFYKPQDVLSFVLFRPDPHLAKSLHYIYFVCVAILFLDIAIIRHFWCRYACIYRVWQHLFKTQQTLHIRHDQSRKSECEKCNYCSTSCFLQLDPTKTDIFDSCINCGECVDACNRLHLKKKEPGLLKFEFGGRDENSNLVNWTTRSGIVGAFFALGMTFFVWGLFHYSPYNIAAYRSEGSRGITVDEYRIQISNKLYEPATLDLDVKGIPRESFSLEKSHVEIAPAMRQNIILHVDPSLPKGIHVLTITAKAANGWTGNFRIEHYSARN